MIDGAQNDRPHASALPNRVTNNQWTNSAPGPNGDVHGWDYVENTSEIKGTLRDRDQFDARGRRLPGVHDNHLHVTFSASTPCP
ncbi:MAG TPA: hypothetical protein VLB46_09180 [Pyrinomonadaceae bacterium]|nr:hypothetical protein [Pyrinomonadaceae bacterium]